MPLDLLQLMLQLPTFRIFNESELKKISSVSIIRGISAGAYAIHEGEEVRSAFFVLSGKMEVVRMAHSGREQVLALLEPGQGFNLASFFQDKKENPASVRAALDSQVMVIPGRLFLSFLSEIPSFCIFVLRDFSSRLSQLTSKVEALGLYSVRARLVRFLLDQADKKEPTLHWTQDEIARHIGTVRDVVGRCLRILEEDDLIHLQRNKIKLLNRESLERIVDQE